MNIKSSAIPRFYGYSVRERQEILWNRGFIDARELQRLIGGGYQMELQTADKMIENVIGVFGLPLGLGLYFLVNGREHVVPMVVEEPSVVAAVSAAAKLIRAAGGFRTESGEPLLIGQIQVMEVPHPVRARQMLLQAREELLHLANSLHPHMVARGGGAKDIEIILHPATGSLGETLVVHLLVDTRDAMGANLVNSMCEAVAGLVEKITAGRVFLRILSNLADRSMVTASCVIPIALLNQPEFGGAEVRDGIVLANEFASIDPYRAATHNKGIMNGIDAVAIATGNDWRAIEASLHAYAARGSRYTALTRWYKNEEGHLCGCLSVPLHVGIVGGSIQGNAAAGLMLKILGVESARQLAEVMVAVGLAQNFAALRALTTEGIQQGHMTLHARSVAAAGGATPEIFDHVVEQLLKSGEIKIWKSKEIVKNLLENNGEAPMVSTPVESDEGWACGHGKIILFGEHAAVYGFHAIAAPIPLAIRARVVEESHGIQLVIPRWGIETRLPLEIESEYSLYHSLALILDSLELRQKHMRIEVFPEIPPAMGLGGSAALAVAIIRALSKHYQLHLSEEEVNHLAFLSEEIVHGTPSGIDNTIASQGKFIIYQKGAVPLTRPINLIKPLAMVVGMTMRESLTVQMVERVRVARARNLELYDRILNEIDDLTLRGFEALCAHNLPQLGDLMNINHGLLNSLQVSCWELEELIEISRQQGAWGAKMTGGGGGGAMIALPKDNEQAQVIAEAMQKKGYQAMVIQIHG